MIRSCWLMIAVMTCAWLVVSAAHADEVVLMSGERFSSDKIWEEKGKIRFNMHGLVVSVQKSDVASIIRGDGSARSLYKPAPNTRPPAQGSVKTVPGPKAPAKPPVVASKPPQRPASPPAPSAKKKPHPQKNVKGIGFDGIAWHMRPSDLSGLSKIETEDVYGGIDQYWQPEGPLSLGDTLLDGLVFGFWQDRLYTIMMWVDGKPGYQRLKRAIFQHYGPGEKSKNQQDRYVWVKDKTTDRLLEFDTERNIGVFWMRSRDLDTHIKQRYPDSTPG